jgi:hypothetical protein
MCSAVKVYFHAILNPWVSGENCPVCAAEDLPPVFIERIRVSPRTGWNMVEKMNISAPLRNGNAVFQAVSTHYTARTIGLDYGTIC